MASTDREDHTVSRTITPDDAETVSGGASITVQRRVEWIDSDPAGIAHWTTALRLVESTETDLHERLGILEYTYGAMPRVHVSANFRHELRVFRAVNVHLQVVHVGTASLRYRFAISDGGDEVAVEGELVAVCIDPERGGSRNWPDQIRTQLLGSCHIDMTGTES